MHRCLQLAKLGMGLVAPNPMVGSVLVHGEMIIGEGYHKKYGEAHAEVNCINSVKSSHLALIPESVLYVSLEPCAHFGKTPPCADLIIKNKIPKVVVGCRDPFADVNGKGIERLRNAGVEVIVGVLENQCKELNKRFFVFHTERRPYVVLKWAETRDGKIASSGSPGGGGATSRLLISNDFTNRIVHKWRSEEMAILVGTNTALFDDPSLTTRLWAGKDPIRIVVDLHLRLPKSLKLFDGTIPTIVFNLHQHNLPFEKMIINDLPKTGFGYYQVAADVNLVHQISNALFRMNIQSVLVEGGAQLLQTFIDDGTWDEARVITNDQLTIGSGLPAPHLINYKLIHSEKIDTDTISFFQPAQPFHIT